LRRHCFSSPKLYEHVKEEAQKGIDDAIMRKQ
jgi:hypothetical protein